MAQGYNMNPLFIIKYAKWIGIGLLITAIGLGIWSIKSTYTENGKLKQTIEIDKISISTLQADVQLQKDLNTALLARKQLVETVEKERIVYVDKIKKADTIYIEAIKKEAEDIKKNNPNELDKFYGTTYNSIIDCIAASTSLDDSKCSK